MNVWQQSVSSTTGEVNLMPLYCVAFLLSKTRFVQGWEKFNRSNVSMHPKDPLSIEKKKSFNNKRWKGKKGKMLEPFQLKFKCYK